MKQPVREWKGCSSLHRWLFVTADSCHLLVCVNDVGGGILSFQSAKLPPPASTDLLTSSVRQDQRSLFFQLRWLFLLYPYSPFPARDIHISSSCLWLMDLLTLGLSPMPLRTYRQYLTGLFPEEVQKSCRASCGYCLLQENVANMAPNCP